MHVKAHILVIGLMLNIIAALTGTTILHIYIYGLIVLFCVQPIVKLIPMNELKTLIMHVIIDSCENFLE